MRIGIAASAALLLLAACASGKPGGTGDVDAPPGGGVDAAIDAPATQIDAPPDGVPGAGFGQPCTTNQSCESGICILSGTHGTCTRLCNDDCPAGYGCLGVDGAVIDGQVSFVCVPQTNQLCSPCSQDSECTQLGQDKCITFADGDKACGEDCTNISCPTGYQCNTIPIGGLNYKQCMPTSNACDCTAANPGSMQACSITTPTGTQCAGNQTCAGATGWNACAPPSATDAPDDTYADQNCDGIDGDASAGIFVSSGGSNDIDCGLSTATPCQTIQWGLTRAAAEAFKWVFVQNGTYTGPIAMKDGINVVGGYNTVWARDSYTVSGHLVTIQGANPAVTFMNLTQTTKLVDVVVHGSDASSTGGSAVGVFVSGSASVELHGVQVTSGVGHAGGDGGVGGTGIDGSDGKDGNPGKENSSFPTCDGPGNLSGDPAVGAGGASSCGRPGGSGGNAGFGDDGSWGGAGWGQNGLVGTGGASPGGQGAHCDGSRSCDGSVGATGASGSGGGAGSAGGSFGAFTGTTYTPSAGGNGSSGTAGQGGSGGGGGGGGTTDCDSTGSSGGGGGGGGCGGGGGFAGTGGGGSFAVVASDSVLVIVKSLITSGTGGTGGRGGGAGMYGVGGNFGNGGAYGGSSEQDDGGDGAAGGHGGHGGLGGPGGGGGGGPSIPVVCLGTSASNAAQSGSTLTPGSGGSGGSITGGNAGAMGTNPQTYNCTAF